MVCPNCNQIIDDSSTFCNNCGAKLKDGAAEPVYSNYSNEPIVPKDNPSHIAGIVSCCFPIVGIVLYLVWKDEKPKSAKLVCYWTLGGFIGGLILYILSIAIGFASFSGPY